MLQRLQHFIATLIGLRRWIFAALGLVALVAGNLYLARLGPRRIDGNVTVLKTNDPALARLTAEIDTLDRTYRAGATDDSITPAALTALNEAIAKQKQLLQLDPVADYVQNDRLKRLEGELEGIRVRDRMGQVEQLQKEGQDALAAHDPQTAAGKLREALRLQREINSSGASLRYKNSVRESVLVQVLATAEAEPIYRELQATLTAAHQAAAELRPPEAMSLLIKARDLQVRLNHDYDRTVYADTVILESIKDELDSLRAGDLAEEIKAKTGDGDRELAQGRSVDAAALYGQARNLQNQLNATFKRSRFYSTDRLDDLEARRQTAASVIAVDLIVGLDQSITGLLRKRQLTEAAQKITESSRTMEKLFTSFPKSTRLDVALKEKLGYLAAHCNDLEEVFRRVYDGSLPLPGTPTLRMLKTEVPQDLYAMVTGANPSRTPGRMLPVDSVNWRDAQDFCRHLSWLVATPVRLPTEAEYLAALGTTGQAGAWSSINSHEMTHPVGDAPPNPAGYYDLLGNVAEWLASDEAGLQAEVAGGSYQDIPSALAKVPLERRDKSDRARFIGFRFVVERPAEFPAAPASGAPQH